jgi:hypothetical protein
MNSRREVIKALAFSLGGGLLNSYKWKGEYEEKEILLPGPVNKIQNAVKAITLGAGARGNVYGDYGIKFPER